MKPNRWPAGDQFHDIDSAPAKDVILKLPEFKKMSVGKRPEFELFDVEKDPYTMKNLADSEEYKEIKAKLLKQLHDQLKKDGDPRMFGKGDIFESYPRVSHMRPFLGGFSERGKYNPNYIQKDQKVDPKDIGKKVDEVPETK